MMRAAAVSGFPEPEEGVITAANGNGRDRGDESAHVSGMVLVRTDLPAHPDTRTGADFVIMTADAA